MINITESRVRIARATLAFSLIFAPLDAWVKYSNGDYNNATTVSLVAISCGFLLWLSRKNQSLPVYAMLGILVVSFAIGMPSLAQHPEIAIWLPLYPFYFYSLAGQVVGSVLVVLSLVHLAAINHWNEFSSVVNIPAAAVAYTFSIVLGYLHESVHNSEHGKLERIALIDNLTGVYNRHGLSSTWDSLYRHALVTNSNISLILLDIDHFKQINDGYGHDMGDSVLQEVVKLVRGRLRASDHIVRWGGEEFLLILPGADTAQAGRIAEQLRGEIASHRFEGVGSVTCSFGICKVDETFDFEAAIKCADEALYLAKREGRNLIRVSDVTASLVT